MKEKIKIIFAAQDPGGFNAILPVIKELTKSKWKGAFILKLFLADESRDIAKKNNIKYSDGNFLKIKELIHAFEKEKPDLLFVSTSWGQSIDKKMIKIAKSRGVKTVSFMDFWANYKSRFSDFNGNNLAYLTDYILLIDKIMEKEMVEEGFDKNKLIVTGGPSFDNFSELIKKKQKEDVISFLCQPISELYKKFKAYPGYDEVEVFKDLMEAFESLKLKIPIIIKFHPKTKKLKKFDKLIKKSKLKILIEKKLSVENLIKKSKIVVGMFTIALFQASIMGKKVLSYQPNLKGRDILVSNRLGLSIAVYEKEKLYPALKELILSKVKNKNLKLLKKYSQNQSTEKVIKFINKITDKNK
jgi:hypothetical protein